jgi:nucleoid DNA-binding protein
LQQRRECFETFARSKLILGEKDIMVQCGGMVLGQLAQIPVDPEMAEDTALVFNGPQFFSALVAGVVLAFAFQLLLTNLGVAAGISLAGGGSSRGDKKDSESVGGTIRKVGFALGLGTLISVTIALFLACLFAVKLSLLGSAELGAIVGLVIWGTYFSLLVWVSSTTVGSLVGSVVNSATSGFQAILGTAAAAIGTKAASKQVVDTAESAAAAVRQEFASAIDPITLRENVEDYLGALRPPELDIRKIRADFEELLQDILNDPRLKEIAESDSLRDIDRQTFVDLVSSRSDLSQRDVNRIVDQLTGAWRKATSKLPSTDALSDFADYLKTASTQQLASEELNRKLDALILELRARRQPESGQSLSQTMASGINRLVGQVLGRTDLSDLDVERIVRRLRELRYQVSDQADKLAPLVSREPQLPPYSTVRADVENYLLNTPSWQMNRETVGREFRNVIYDPQADPETMARELVRLNRIDFADLLGQRGVFTQQKIRELSELLESIRLEALAVAREAQEQERRIALMAQVEQYLYNTPKADLTPEKIQLNFKPILTDRDADYEQLQQRLEQFDRMTLQRLLDGREEISPEEREGIVNSLEEARDRALRESQERQEAAKAQVQAQWLKIQSYLRETGRDELDPEAIERELRLLIEAPQAGLAAIRERTSRFDRETLVQILNQRSDLSEAQIHQILDRVERAWMRVRYTPEKLAGQAKAQYDETMSAIAEYLRNTGRDELNPEGIKRDLTKLLEEPRVGVQALRSRLAEVDRDTLVQLLAQREDLSEAQVNQIIDEVLSVIRSIIRAPRRLASRTTEQVQDFQEALADYLRSTDKEELSPEGIKRDMEELFHHPRAGMSSLQDRLSQCDRSTLVALLSQREDISEADVNQIVDRILEVRDRTMAQIQAVQHRIQTAIDRIFERIRDYLNSLERPELNYDGIKQDIRTLFDDPQAGFEALRDRLSQFNRETLVAIMSSREDISEADANRIIDQIERTRTSVLRRAERLQREAQLRIDEMKYQAQRQAEETRKAAATASWWLFFTALISAGASAGAGAIGVID